MEQNEAIQKARQFARTAYAGQADENSRAHQQNIVVMRNQLAARGMIQSGAMVSETARIAGEQIRALTEASLSAIVEDYELYGVGIDDQMAVNICDEVIQGMNQRV